MKPFGILQLTVNKLVVLFTVEVFVTGNNCWNNVHLQTIQTIFVTYTQSESKFSSQISSSPIVLVLFCVLKPARQPSTMHHHKLSSVPILTIFRSHHFITWSVQKCSYQPLQVLQPWQISCDGSQHANWSKLELASVSLWYLKPVNFRTTISDHHLFQINEKWLSTPKGQCHWTMDLIS